MRNDEVELRHHDDVFKGFDAEKAESARIFSEKYYLAKSDEVYQKLMQEHKEKYEHGE